MEAERVRVETELTAFAAARAEEDGGDDAADHDDRKLKKADRMRLVVKNKVGSRVALAHAARLLHLGSSKTLYACCGVTGCRGAG